ncbi:MAG: carbohydrate ABC transporter permease [Rhizobacter sp.]
MSAQLSAHGAKPLPALPLGPAVARPAARRASLSRRARGRLGAALYYGVSITLTAVFLFPIAWSAWVSFFTPADAMASPPVMWPSRLSVQNYLNLADYGQGIARYLWNSAVVTLLTVAMTLVLATLGGYGFSRFRFPGRNLIFAVILATLMIPFQSILTPLFILLRVLHLQDTLIGLALVYTTFQLPFAVFMLRNTFDVVPREVEEAALLDGCSPLGCLLRVMLPLVKPGLVTVGLFAFFGSWNELLAALILMGDARNFTLPVMLLNAQSGHLGGVNWGLMQAGITISILPCALLFLLLQRYYINGLIAGAVKA